MHAMRNLLSPWKALVTAIAVFASAGSAKADLSLVFISGSGVQEISTPLVNGSTGVISVGNFTGTYTIHSTLTAAGPGAPGGALAVRTLSIDIQATNNSTFSRMLTAILQGSDLSGPGNGAGFLVSGIKVTSATSAGSNAKFKTDSTYEDGSGGYGTATTGEVSATTFSSPNAITINNPYTLTTQSIESVITGGGSFNVTGSTQVYGVPEPSGIAAALAGVPCLGLLLGTVRRRLTGNPAPTV